MAAVFLDGKRLEMAVGENEQEHIMGLESGELMLLWQLNRPDAGEAVEITTGAHTLSSCLEEVATTFFKQIRAHQMSCHYLSQ